MNLRRARSEPLDVDAYEGAYAQLFAIRDAHVTCTETPLDCRAGILWATNTTAGDFGLDLGSTRSLLLHHCAEVNELLATRSSGRAGALLVAGTRLQAAQPARSF